MKKEAKVGLLGIIALSILYLGFNFLKGLDVFRTENEYYVSYPDVEGLQTSNPVMFSGVVIGRVMAIEPEQDKNQVRVTLAIRRTINITDKTIAIMADNGLLGGKMVKLQINKGNPLGDEGVLQGTTAQGMLGSVTEKLDPTLRNADSLMVNLTKIVKQFDQTGAALKTMIASANQTTNGVNGVIASNSKNLNAITGNAALLSVNANNLTTKLNDLTNSMDAQIKPILQKTNKFADSLNVIQLGNTVAQLSASVAGLKGILNEINAGKGTLGKLAKDDSLYVNLDKTAANAAKLLEDLKTSPKKYVHFSLFGRKDKK